MELRDYQEENSTKAAELLRNYKISYLAMETRTGKTITALEACNKLGLTKVLFVTKKKAILYWCFSDGGIEQKIYETVKSKQDYTNYIFRIEVKDTGKEPNDLQFFRLNELQALGFKAFWTDNPDDEQIQEMLK